MTILWKAHPTPLSLEQIRLREAIDIWEGTPYSPGQCLAGVGVDCLRFVAAVASYMEGREIPPIRSLPQDTAFHQPEEARKAIRQLMSNFPRWSRVRKVDALYPGDLLVVGPNGIPAHGMVVSSKKNQLIHASPQGVVPAAAQFDNSRRFCALYRMGGVA
jgi:hypothetical protein